MYRMCTGCVLAMYRQCTAIDINMYWHSYSAVTLFSHPYPFPPPPFVPPSLVQIGLLREYWELEFTALALPFKMDVERIVDDFVLFCMLIGNDFLPCEKCGV